MSIKPGDFVLTFPTRDTKSFVLRRVWKTMGLLTGSAIEKRNKLDLSLEARLITNSEFLLTSVTRHIQ